MAYNSIKMISVTMITIMMINILEVRLTHGSTMTVLEFNRKAEEGIVTPLGIDRCNSFVMGSKTNLDMVSV